MDSMWRTEHCMQPIEDSQALMVQRGMQHAEQGPDKWNGEDKADVLYACFYR